MAYCKRGPLIFFTLKLLLKTSAAYEVPKTAEEGEWRHAETVALVSH